MEEREEIDQYDVVEIVRVPEHYEGVMDIGDVGVVVEKHGDGTFQVECVRPGGASKWLEPLSAQYLRLRNKDPYSSWIQKSLADPPLMPKSIRLGAAVGAAFGGLIGAAFGAITLTLNGVLVGWLIGLTAGVVTGVLTAALTVRTAGTTGGIGVGYYVGMILGGLLGMLLGGLVPPSWRMSAHTEGLPVLDALMLGRFETAMLTGFLLSILGTIVGVWVGGRNFVPRNLRERYRP